MNIIPGFIRKVFNKQVNNSANTSPKAIHERLKSISDMAEKEIKSAPKTTAMSKVKPQTLPQPQISEAEKRDLIRRGYGSYDGVHWDRD